MPKKLLLADDSITIQKVVGITFAQEDFDITYVDNGVDAISKAQTVKPDIILADIVMPQKNGYDVCEAIKKNADLKHIPILLLAGTFETFDVNRGKMVGADDYIIKPFESQALIDKVNSLLSGKPAAAATAAAKPAPAPAVVAKPVPPPPAAPAPVASKPAAADKFQIDSPMFGDADVAPIAEVAKPAASDDAYSFDTSGTFDLSNDFSTNPPPKPEVTEGFGEVADLGGSQNEMQIATAAEIMMDDIAAPGAVPAASMSEGIDLPEASADASFDTDAFSSNTAPAVGSEFGLDTPFDAVAGNGSEYSSDAGGLDLPPLPDGASDENIASDSGNDFGAVSFGVPAAPIAATAMPQIDEAQVRKIIEEKVRETVEKIAWEVIPDLAERVIMEEIKRLTSNVTLPKA